MTSRRIILVLSAAAMAVVFVYPIGHGFLSSKDWSDEVKLQKVNAMYEGYKKQFPKVWDLSAQEAMDLTANRKTVLIDIRETREQEISMLPNAITEKDFMDDLAKHKDAVKIVYCTISYRSGKFAQKLQETGIPVYNLRGGILAWVHAGGKVYDQKGETHRIHVYGRKWNLGPKRYQAVW